MTATKGRLDLGDTALARLIDEAAGDHYTAAGCTGCAFHKQLEATADALRARAALAKAEGK